MVSLPSDPSSSHNYQASPGDAPGSVGSRQRIQRLTGYSIAQQTIIKCLLCTALPDSRGTLPPISAFMALINGWGDPRWASRAPICTVDRPWRPCSVSDASLQENDSYTGIGIFYSFFPLILREIKMKPFYGSLVCQGSGSLCLMDDKMPW